MILFNAKTHKRYLSMLISYGLPHDESDSVRLTLAYFALSGLDILNDLGKIEAKKEGYIDWIYKLHSKLNNVAGFQNTAAFNNDPNYSCGHIAATYSALNLLLILGNDLSRLDKQAITQSLRLLQLKDGSYCASFKGTENDMRFVYCAASICYILDDWSGMNVDLAVEYILNSINYDGGIGQGPYLEAHGGSTYCAVATLVLTNRLHRLSSKQKNRLVLWILRLQREGFQGRPNKKDDTCYTFWLGASLKMLESFDFINSERLLNFVMSTQDFQTGGFAKWCGCASDPLHTYLGLAGLSLMKYEGLNEVVPSLNITARAFKHLNSLHNSWRV